MAEIILKLVSNQTPRERGVGRGGEGGTLGVLKVSSSRGKLDRAQFGLGGGGRKKGTSK